MKTKLAIAFLVVALLVSGTVAGVPITEHGSSLNAQNQTDAEVGFDADTVKGYQNETVTIPITLDGTETATVEIGGEAVNYVLVATVTDADGDGRVVLALDIPTAGTDSTPVSVNGTDEVSLESESELKHPPLDAGNYPLTLYAGSGTDGNETDAATMLLLESEETAQATTATETVTTESTTAEATTDVATESEPTETNDDTESSVPGFGPILALIALAAAAMLAARRGR